MLDIFSRHRPLALLAGVVLAQILLLAFQIKRDHEIRLIRYWAAKVVTPEGRAGTWTFSKVRGAWTGYVALRNAHAESERLHSELDRLRLRNRELESQAAEAQRLSVLLNFREAHPEAQMLAAQVIGASADPASHTLFINRGERDRVRRNLAVITPDGIVGKIVEVFPTTSQVLLINDKDSGVGALFEDTRTHGVLKGNGDPEPLMEYVVNDGKVHPGEAILTSGEDRIFPKGLLIGTVADTAPGNPFEVIHVQPAARLDRLEDVMVLLFQQELAPKKTGEFPVAVGTESGAQAGGQTAAEAAAGSVAPARKPAPPSTSGAAPNAVKAAAGKPTPPANTATSTPATTETRPPTTAPPER